MILYIKMDGIPMATAQTSYNTKAGSLLEEKDEKNEQVFKVWKQGKYRDFLLTLNCEINNDKEKSKEELLKKLNELMKYLTHLKYSYLLSSIELNKKDFYHIHIFIQFNTPHKLSTNKTQGAHINIINKTINTVIKYVKKDGVILKELGTPRYITGNPSIKDISLSRFSEINENGNAKFYRVYKEIKKDNQGLKNCIKNIYIINNKNNIDLDRFENYNYLKINSKSEIKQWPHNMIINNRDITKALLDALLSKFNEPLQYKYFPNDIENIILILDTDIYNDLLIYNYLIKFYNNHKIEFLYNTGELESTLSSLNPYDSEDNELINYDENNSEEEN